MLNTYAQEHLFFLIGALEEANIRIEPLLAQLIRELADRDDHRIERRSEFLIAQQLADRRLVVVHAIEHRIEPAEQPVGVAERRLSGAHRVTCGIYKRSNSRAVLA